MAAGASLIFIVLKAWFLAPRFSDGAIYAYLGQRVMDGAVPYVDFFYSSPPLLPYIFGIIGVVLGWHWWSWAWLPIALSVVDAGLLYWLAKRWWSSEAAIVTAVCYLFSYVVLATTDFPTDAHFIVTLFLVATVAQVRRWNVVSGILLALAVCIKLYAIVLVVPFMAWLFWQRDWKAVVRVGGGLLLTGGVVVTALSFLTGSLFYQAIITNNLGRGIGIPRERLLPFIFWHDPWLLLGLMMPLFVRRWAPALTVFLVVAPLSFLLLYPDIYYLYFKLMAPALALLLGWGSMYVVEEYGRWARVGMLIVVAVSAVMTGARYVWEQAHAAVINDFSGLTAYVEETTAPDDLLYGDFEVAPFVALESERRLYGDLADTNIKFFLTGVFSTEERLQELVAARVPILITKGVVEDKSVLGGYEQTVTPRFINEYCRVGKIFPIARDYTHNAVVVWLCSY